MTASNPSQAELAALRTKKIWEKVIGAKFNKNDEINHIAEQQALFAMAMSQLGPIGGRKGKR
jgi:hypothetical protein